MLERIIIGTLRRCPILSNLPSLKLLAYEFIEAHYDIWEFIKSKELISVKVSSGNCVSLRSFLDFINKDGCTNCFKHINSIWITGHCKVSAQQELTQKLFNTLYEKSFLFPSLKTIFIDPENERCIELPAFQDPINIVYSVECNGNSFLSLDFNTQDDDTLICL